MKMPEIRKKAAQLAIPGYSKLRKADLIRSIQKHENNPVCYATGKRGDCSEAGRCCWAADCK